MLTTRIAWLLSQGLVSPAGILAVTFTNKAAKEMLTRLQAMLPINARGMWIGTFHGLCNRFLRAHYKLANLPQSFQILDTQDQLSAIKRLCKQHNVDDERFPPKQLSMVHQPAARKTACALHNVDARDPDTRKKVELYQLYEEQCQREGVVDFGELMLRSFELLRDNDPIRAHYQRRFRHILIDEFQDTNKLQYAWIKLLAGQSEPEGRIADAGAVLAVGDDDQSIYAFRGARVGNMADFVREFGVRHQIKLEQNYRSFSNILDSANALIGHNANRLGKNLRTDQGAGEPVRVVSNPSDFDEARWVVDEIKQLVRDEVPKNEIAILYRSNAQSRVVETSLFNAGLPYRVYGGLRFFERAEIKHALAYLRLLENPNDDTSFLRVVNFPARGIGARSIEQLQDIARDCGLLAARRGQLPHGPRRYRHCRLCGQGGRDARADTQAQAQRNCEVGAGPQRPAGALPARQGRRRPPRKLGRTGQRRRELCHAGRLWPRSTGHGSPPCAAPPPRQREPHRTRRMPVNLPKPAKPSRPWPPS